MQWHVENKTYCFMLTIKILLCRILAMYMPYTLILILSFSCSSALQQTVQKPYMLS